MDELDLSKIKISEVVAEDETEDWELVSKYEDGVEVPCISYSESLEADEEVDSLVYKTITESDRQKQGIYPRLNKESGRETQRKQESVRRKEIKAVRTMDEVSQSKPLILEQKDAGIVKEKEGVQKKLSPHKLGQKKASARNVEGLEYLQEMEKKNEMSRKQLVGSLQNIFKEDPDCERLRRELLRALRDDEYVSEIEKIRKIVETLGDASSRDRDKRSLRREMIEALQVSTQSDQGNERSNLEMVEVPKDVSQCDTESKWLRREMMDDMQGKIFNDQESEKFKREIVEVSKAAPKCVQGSRREGRCIEETQTDESTNEERVWRRKVWIAAMRGELAVKQDELSEKEIKVPNAASKYDQGSESLGREIIEALKEESQSETERESLKREVIEVKQDASHYQQYKESVRQIIEARRIAARLEKLCEKVRRETSEAMKDLLQSCKKPESELSQSQRENERKEMPFNERLSPDVQSREIKSFTSQDPESAPVESSAAAVHEVVSSEAMKDLSQCEEEYEKNKMPKMVTNENFRDLQLQGFKFFIWKEPNPATIKSSAAASGFQKVVTPAAMKDLSQYEKENEVSEIDTNERFVRDLQLQEFKSFNWQEPESAPVKSSSTAAAFQEVPEKYFSQNLNKAVQGTTSTQSKTHSKLQLKATLNESLPERAVDCDFVELFLQDFECNLKVSDEVTTEFENSDGKKDLRVKISKDSVSFKNEDSPSSDTDESEKDCTKENN